MSTRAYSSPVREQKARQTREAILEALFDLIRGADRPEDIGMEEVGRAAGVQRRTVFRHFATRETLFAEFWVWLNDRIGVSPAPRVPEDILDGPRAAFPRFDTHEAVMRAMLHSRTGREMRAGTVERRRENFERALAPVCDGLPPETAARITAVAHLLYSASAWEVLKDYGGLSGAQAGETASWALEVILSAVTRGEDCADVSSHTKDSDHES